jgi:hypothetical protein
MPESGLNESTAQGRSKGFVTACAVRGECGATHFSGGF